MFAQFHSIECCTYFVSFGMSAEMYNARRKDHKIFHCPNGHGQHFTRQSEEEKLRLERDRLKQQLAQKDDTITHYRDSRDAANRKVVALKGVVTKTKKRISGGVCPCGNRTFQNLAEHMKSQHKHYADEEVA